MKASLANVALRLELTPEELERRSLRAYLQQDLREVQAEILRLCARYGVSDSEGMLAQYRSGKLPETDTWEDFFRLDHLEARRRELKNLLGNLI
jgi:hypothetical protein